MTEKEINELKKKLTEEEHHSFGSLLELVTRSPIGAGVPLGQGADP